jgi:hypothetical protein
MTIRLPVGHEAPPAGDLAMDSPDDLGRLARRDVAVFVAGTAAAAVGIVLFAVSRAGLVREHAAAAVVLILAFVVCIPCLAWWTAGPPKLLRSRLLVLVPVFLLAGPALASLLVLGATVTGASLVTGLAVVVGLILGVMLGPRRRA